jgi:hypothetical protein
MCPEMFCECCEPECNYCLSTGMKLIPFVLTTGKYIERLSKMMKKGFVLDNKKTLKCEECLCEKNNVIKIECGHSFCAECLIHNYMENAKSEKTKNIEKMNKDFQNKMTNNIQKFAILLQQQQTKYIEKYVSSYVKQLDDDITEHIELINNFTKKQIRMEKINGKCYICNKDIKIINEL